MPGLRAKKRHPPYVDKGIVSYQIHSRVRPVTPGMRLIPEDHCAWYAAYPRELVTPRMRLLSEDHSM